MRPSIRFSPRAVALGFLTDIALTKFFVLALVLVLIDPGSSSEAPLHRMNLQLLDWFCLSWGLGFTAVGGFVACRLAPRAGYLHASAVACLSMLFGFLDGWSPENVELPLYLTGIWLTFPVAWLGAAIAHQFKTKN
jgi:hypothetical protein